MKPVAIDEMFSEGVDVEEVSEKCSEFQSINVNQKYINFDTLEYCRVRRNTRYSCRFLQWYENCKNLNSN